MPVTITIGKPPKAPEPWQKLPKPEIPVCKTCGSTRVLFDAYASWNAQEQRYELHGDAFDYVICEEEGKCEGSETKVKWVPLAEWLKTASADAKQDEGFDPEETLE